MMRRNAVVVGEKGPTLKAGSAACTVGRTRGRCVVISLYCLIWLVSLLSASASWAQDDRYLEGYARALLDREYRLTDLTVQSTNGVLLVRASDLGGLAVLDIIRLLESIPGVAHVEVEVGRDPDAGAPPAQAASAVAGAQPSVALSPWLPSGLLFTPLHADPRWPRFALAYRRYLNGGDLKNGGVANIGGALSIYRSRSGSNKGQWEVGIQAGSFALFDMTAQSGSNDIRNTDFTVALFHAYRQGRFSSLLRLVHLSSHLGDEFIKNTQTTRMEVNHDRVDVMVSYEPQPWLRVYGGGGIQFRQSPDGLGFGRAQAGMELKSLRTLWAGRLRPVAYADIQCEGRTGWSFGQRLMAGVQFDNLRLDGRTVQLLVEHYVGPVPDGQFFLQKAQWLGVGLHFYF